MNSLLDNIQLLGSGRMSAVLALVAIISFGLILADSSQTAAQASELGGVDRGAILDAEGGVLANVAPGSNGRGMLAQRFPSLAASLGYQDSVGRWHGLEGSYNAALSGDGSRSSFTGFLNHLMGRQIVGDNVRTTIEPGVQEVAQRALRGRKGAVVAIDPRTGAVLALASTPCRPDKPCLDRATSFLSPPGSCFKIVTLSAALDSGEFTLNSLFSGTDAFGPNPNFDNSLYPSNVTRSDLTVLTLAQALAFSDNFVFAHIGATLGAKVLSSYAHRFYLDRRIPFALPVARSTIFADHANPTLAELETSSFGATADQVTPLQMALIVSTVANHGV
ncbi:MAG: penicillin-binding transpeptidase domain-containing protein, partial [Chloroflexota bacterium]